MPENFSREAVAGGSFKERIRALSTHIKKAPTKTEQEIIDAMVLCLELEALIIEAANAAGGTLYDEAEVTRFYEELRSLENSKFKKQSQDGTYEDVRKPALAKKAYAIFDTLPDTNSANKTPGDKGDK